MTKEFSKRNRKRCEDPKGFNHKLNSWSGSDWMVAVFGELGEAANIQKKLNRFRDGIPGNKETKTDLEKKFRQELADAYIYLDLLIQAHGIDNFDEIVEEVFNVKSKEIGYTE
jgi:NTP pyrophosphatase (non-canonical NTP hydrolase)